MSFNAIHVGFIALNHYGTAVQIGHAQTSHPPADDADVATKKYIDDSVVTYTFADPLTLVAAEVGVKSASATDPGGLGNPRDVYFKYNQCVLGDIAPPPPTIVI